MIKKLDALKPDDLPMDIGVSMDCNIMINANKVHAVAPILDEESDIEYGLGIYYSEDTSSPDLILGLGSTDKVEEVIKFLEDTYRRNKMKVVKLNFNKEDNHEV